MKIKSTTGPKELTYAVVTQVMLDLDDIYKFYEVSPSWAFKEFLKKNNGPGMAKLCPEISKKFTSF